MLSHPWVHTALQDCLLNCPQPRAREEAAQGQGCPQGPSTTCSPHSPLWTPSFSQHWKLVFQLLNVSSSRERQVLTKVFLKGKFTEQLNCHLQNKGEALPGQPRPAHLALPGLQGPPRVGGLALRCRGPWKRVLLSRAHACLPG